MHMRKLSLAILLIAAAPLANAADGTISFTGKVTDKTCTIATTGGGNFAVNLPTVSKSSLATAGAVAGRTPFSISLTQCTAGNVATYFEPGSTVDSGTGRLNNQTTSGASGGASNVQLQLLGDNAQFLPIKAAGAGQPQSNSQWATVGANGAANLTYYVEYIATGAATAGDVTSNIKYTIIYN